MAMSMEKLQVEVGIDPAQVFGNDVVDFRQVPTREEQPTAGASDPVATHYRKPGAKTLYAACACPRASSTLRPWPVKVCPLMRKVAVA